MNPAPTIFFQCDREGNWLHVDPAWHSLSGTSAANWLKAVHTSDRERVQQAWQTAINQHSAFACTYRLASSTIHINHRASPTETGFIGALNVIPLPQANLLDLMFSQALDGMFLMLLDEPLAWNDDIDKEAALDYAFGHQRVTRVNQAMLDQYGAKEQDFLGYTPVDFFAHDLAHGRSTWRELFNQGRLVADTYEQRLDGTAIIIEGDYTCLYDAEGRILGHFGTQRDVTQQRALEQALAEQQRLLERITDATPNGVYIYDLQTHANAYANRRISEILGYTYADITAQGSRILSDNIHPDDWPRIAAHLDHCLSLADREVAEIEYRFRHGDGHWCWLLSRDVVFSRTPEGNVQQILGVLQDTSDRKLLEQQLSENLARFEQLIQNVPALVYRYEIDTTGIERLTYLSARAEEMFELPIEACLADINSLWALIDPAAIEAMTAASQRSQTEGVLWQVQFKLTTPSGVQKWIEANAVPSQQPDGHLIFDGVMLDITERKEIEHQLQQQIQREQAQNRITQAIRQTLDINLIFATATQEITNLWPVQSASIAQYDQDSWLKIYGTQNDLGQPSSIGTRIPDRDNPFAARLKAQEIVCVSTNEITDPVNQRVAAEFPGSWLLVPIIINNQTWGAYTLLATDPDYAWPAEDIALVQAVVNQLVIAIQQAELYKQLQILNSGLEVEVEQRTAELQTALNLADLQTHITEQLRYSLDEDLILQTAVDALGSKLNLIRCSVCLFFEGEPQIHFIYNDSSTPVNHIPLSTFPNLCDDLHQGKSPYFSIQIEKEWFTAFLVPIYDEQALLGDILTLRQRDVGFLPMEMQLIQQIAAQCAIALRQSRLYQAAQDQVKELQRLNHLKDDFLSTVSHELRTPMTSIKLAIQMLETRLGNLDIPPAVQTYLKILRDESDREIRLINDLLDMAKLEAGTLELNLSEVDTCRLIERLIQAQSLRTEAQQQTVVLECMPHLPPITTDAVLLERVCAELLHNAVKYTPADNTITISLSVMAGQFAMVSDRSLAIAITNTGVSLPRQELSLVFDKFYRLTSTDQWRHGGTGLGLALVKQVVVALGGRIWANSTDSSVTFNVHLPLRAIPVAT